MTRKLPLATALVLLPSIAMAHCDRPARPGFPDPKTAAPAVVEKLAQEMEHYDSGMTAYVQCLAREADEAQKEGTETINFYNQKFLPEYNKRAAAPAQ